MAKSLTLAQLKQRSDAGKIGGRIGGKKGGQAAVEKYGHEHYVRIGKLGGRPTWQEALAKANARQAELDAKRVKRGMLEEVVDGYVEGLGQRGQRLGGASALPSFNLGKVNGIDAGDGGQLVLGHISMTPIHPERVLPGQEPVRHFDGKGLACFCLGAVVKLIIAQQRFGVFVRQAFVFEPWNHREGRLSCGIENNLRLVHYVLLSFVGLPPWNNAHHVNNLGGIIPLKNNPKLTDSETQTGPSSQWGYIQIPSVRVLGQSVQFVTNTQSLLTRHLLQGSYSLALESQLVQPFSHTQYYSITLYIYQALRFSLCSGRRPGSECWRRRKRRRSDGYAYEHHSQEAAPPL